MVKFAWRLMALVAFGWAAYVVAEAGWTYYATRDAVDTVLREATARYRTPLRTGTFTDSMLTEVRDWVARDAARSGVPVHARDVAVSATAAGISATVHYSYPVIRDILVVPLSVQRSLRGGFPS